MFLNYNQFFIIFTQYKNHNYKNKVFSDFTVFIFRIITHKIFSEIYEIQLIILYTYFIMGKSRKNRVIKDIKTTAVAALPVVDKSLTKIGTAAKDVAQASIPVVEQGVSAVYGTMATGLDLGVKGVKNITKRLKTRQISRSLSRGRKLAGGRTRSRRHRRRMSRHRKH
jgi:hypothetical protein